MALMWTLGLFGLSLLMSQTAIDLFASLLVIQVLWMGYRWREQNSQRSLWNPMGIDWLFLVWIGIVFAGYAVNGFEGDNWYMKLLEFRWIFIFYICITALRQLEPDESWVKFVAGAFLVCSLWAVVVWFMGFDPLHPNDQLQVTGSGVLRTGGFLFQPIAFAHLYQLPLCLLMGVLFPMLRWREKGTWLVALSFAVGTLAIFLSFTRGVWLSMTVAALVMAFLYSRRLAVSLAVVVVAVFAGAYELSPTFHERVRFGIDGGDAERIWMWKANLEMFKEHPIVGIGYGENVNALTEYYHRIGAPPEIIAASTSHAHNQYLQMLSGTGILGFAVYLIIVLYFLILALRVWYRIGSREVFYQGLALGLIGAQVAFLVGGLTESNLEHSKMRHAMLLIWALTVWLAYRFSILRERISHNKS